MQNINLEIDALSDKINTINQNVQFNITLMWAIAAVVVAIVGFAIYFITKEWTKKCVKKELEEMRNDINILKKNTMINSGGVPGCGYIHFHDGTHICYLKCNVSITKSCVQRFVFPCAFNKEAEICPTINILNNKNVIATIESVDAGGIHVLFTVLDKSQTVNNLKISILAIGKFE
ncbi:hypothetical protein [Clostridium sp. Marseille-Q2269]|uniref:hypothetical protein n=1 Tax=Clostridium sp. Marseille-Q2269 TaxID=2942205 RepID=UPI0020737870|nr:hypothetical protein [Clostridium sp. Marseille-Q2269]